MLEIIACSKEISNDTSSETTGEITVTEHRRLEIMLHRLEKIRAYRDYFIGTMLVTVLIFFLVIAGLRSEAVIDDSLLVVGAVLAILSGYAIIHIPFELEKKLSAQIQKIQEGAITQNEKNRSARQ